MFNQYADEFNGMSPIKQLLFIDHLLSQDTHPRVEEFCKDMDKYYFKTFRDADVVNYFHEDKRGQEILRHALIKSFRFRACYRSFDYSLNSFIDIVYEYGRDQAFLKQLEHRYCKLSLMLVFHPLLKNSIRFRLLGKTFRAGTHYDLKYRGKLYQVLGIVFFGSQALLYIFGYFFGSLGPSMLIMCVLLFFFGMMIIKTLLNA